LEKKKLLHPLILLIFLNISPTVSSQNCGQKANSCAVSSGEDALSKDIQFLHDSSLQKVEKLLKDAEFQSIVSEMKTKSVSPSHSVNISETSKTHAPYFSDFLASKPPSSYVFVSFSMGEKSLLSLAIEAKRYNVSLVLRGFKEGSYTKTAKALQRVIQKTGQGFIIDPELFTLFNVTAVPTFIVSKPVPLFATERVQTPLHDRLQGHVSLRYVLELFAKEGDLKNDAEILLEKGSGL
jgi:type-F conjugative transfer system pilin assembly protein TrbC